MATGIACSDKTMTDQRAIHVVIFDGFADWEPAHALAELRRWGKRTVRTVGFAGTPVISMGGLRIMPDLELASVRPEDVELLILPGGDLWQTGAYPRPAIDSLIAALLAAETPIAAICAGTLALARAHALDDRRHTSNMRSYLPAYATEYSGGAHFLESPAVTDRHVITASGLAAVDFARAIFAELGMFTAKNEALWFDMFKHGKLPPAAI
jgi:putative intracellular protease/amidase